ncbi:hypothetical protein dsx2_1995 [Desulfovibrio sp. X2]|uniref:hypothetical protein n=1 Tax=Desulfovibrio sp. X2 TaxID=941449 RepID=UPI0003589165|nr:hypothetical protein [Desulfovibrio sp. X2]EPR43956.1 hypothetical protein dsx2_1995 [Desulfovibrio sp. X2]
MKKLLLVLVLLAAAAPVAPVSAGTFCPSYGVSCYRTPKADPSMFLLEIGNKDGDYMGSIRLLEGECGFFCCGPCDESKRDVDWDARCNSRFVECQGRCKGY